MVAKMAKQLNDLSNLINSAQMKNNRRISEYQRTGW